MLSDVLKQIVTRALLDPGFRHRLIQDVRQTLVDEGYELDEETIQKVEAAARDDQQVQRFTDGFSSEMLDRPEFVT